MATKRKTRYAIRCTKTGGYVYDKIGTCSYPSKAAAQRDLNDFAVDPTTGYEIVEYIPYREGR